MSAEVLSDAEVAERLAALHADWTGDSKALRRSIEFADFGSAASFINALAPICEELDHHPDLALRWRWVDAVLTTHSAGGVTELDVRLAGEIDEVAATIPQP